MLEIRCVASSSGPLPSLLKSRYEGQNSLTPGAPGFEAQKYISNMKKKSSVSEPLGSDA